MNASQPSRSNAYFMEEEQYSETHLLDGKSCTKWHTLKSRIWKPENMTDHWCHSIKHRESQKRPLKLMDFGAPPSCWHLQLNYPDQVNQFYLKWSTQYNRNRTPVKFKAKLNDRKKPKQKITCVDKMRAYSLKKKPNIFQLRINIFCSLTSQAKRNNNRTLQEQPNFKIICWDISIHYKISNL